MKRSEWLLIALLTLLPAAPAAAQSGPQIALLDSQNTKDFFLAHYDLPCPYLSDGNEYVRYFGGWEVVLKRLQNDPAYGYAVIQDGDVTAAGLSPYKILILSNIALLSDDQTRAIHKWVLQGGRLLATFGSGYKDLADDPRQDDGWKEQKGGTFGLHQLWHDPMTKLFSTYNIPPIGPGSVQVDVRITRYEGPTSDLASSPNIVGDILGYGAWANVLVQRPANHHDVLAFLRLGNAEWKAPMPAIISTEQAKGLVVYFAFAPEYIVYKEAELLGEVPDELACKEPGWLGRSGGCEDLMINALNFLLGR